jgi:hypothetical protein
MVAVKNGAAEDGSLPITVAAGDDASGLANIIGQYLEQLFTDLPEKRTQAAALRGRLGLRASEGDVAVTLVFEENGIVIEEELKHPDASISGEVEMLMHLLAGRVNPAAEIVRRTLTIQPSLRRPFFGYQAYSLMRLPGVHPWSGLPRPPLALVLGAAASVLGALLLVRHVRTPAQGGDDA